LIRVFKEEQSKREKNEVEERGQSGIKLVVGVRALGMNTMMGL
jgi:hypothetical protein